MKFFKINIKPITIYVLLLIVLIFSPLIYMFIKNIFGISLGLKNNFDYDWLSYYGSVLGGLITVFGIIITLKSEREKSLLEYRNSVRTLLNLSVVNLKKLNKIENDDHSRY